MRSQIQAFLSQPLMLDPAFIDRLKVHQADSDYRSRGVFFNAPCPKQAAETALAAARQQPKSGKYTAVVPVFGMIDQHQSDMLDWIGGTSTDALSSAMEMLVNDDRISNILMRFHTPGGTVHGVKETSDSIFQMRSAKPICAVADSMMASAGYYMGASASRVYATPGADVGSVGVYQMHFDMSKMYAESGIGVTITREPEFKAEGNPYEPLPDAALNEMKADVHRVYQMFTSDVARYRDVDVQNVRESFGKGRCMDAASAVKCGMINRVATFAEVLGRMQAGTIRPGAGMAAMDDWDGSKKAIDDLQQQRQRRVRIAAKKGLL